MTRRSFLFELAGDFRRLGLLQLAFLRLERGRHYRRKFHWMVSRTVHLIRTLAVAMPLPIGSTQTHLNHWNK